MNNDQRTYTVKPVHTGMPWGQRFTPVWTGSGLDRVFPLERNKQRYVVQLTCATWVIIQDVSSVGLQMIGRLMQKKII